MLHRRMVPENQEEDEDWNIPLPVDQAARQRRQALAALIGSSVFDAVKSVAEETIARWFIALPTKTADEKLQYADYKMVSDAVESLLQQIVQEGQQGFQDEYGEDAEREYPNYQQHFEDSQKWTSLKTN